MKALFDGDIIVFRCAFAAERQQWYLSVGGNPPETFAYKREAVARLDELLPGVWSREEGKDYEIWAERYLEPVEHAYHNVNVLVEKALRATECTEFDAQFYLTGKGQTFRHLRATTRPYKGNRDPSHRPTYEDEVRRYIRSKYPTIVTEGIEADDALGIAQTKIGPHDSVIVSLDKDLDQIVGMKYNFVNEILYEITPELAWKKYCLQLLTGDATDNIPGLPKIGAKKAEKILDGLDPSEWLEEVARQYAAKSGREDWFDYLREQADLVWIMKDEDDRELIPESFRSLGGGTFEGSELTLEVE